ncbi:MAG: hypothetical protein ACXV8K_18840 [Ilumatobacteraceae bacterium]
MFAQQIAARQQLEQMRQLPPGALAGNSGARMPGDTIDVGDRPGTYL